MVAYSFTLYGLKFPNDGVYYIAVASSLLEHGKPQDISVIPAGPFLTHQNGIIYFILLLKYALGDIWIVGYIFIVTVLWSNLSLVLVNLFSNLIKSYFSRELLFIPLVFCFVPILNFSSLNTISGMYNEAIINPVLWISFALFLKHLSQKNFTIITNKKYFNIDYLYIFSIVLFVYLLGLFFRIQAATYIVSFYCYLVYFKFITFKKATIILIIPFLLFAVYVDRIEAPFSSNLISKVFSIGPSDLAERSLRVLSLITSPISLMSSSSPVYLIKEHIFYILLPATILFAFGLKNLMKINSQIFSLIVLIFFFNAVFVFLMPVYSYRYEQLVLVPGLVLYLFLLFSLFEKKPQLIINALTVIIIVASLCLSFFYTTLYLKNKTEGNLFDQVNVHSQIAGVIENIGPSVIFSQNARLTYWESGHRSCVETVTTCKNLLNLKEKYNVVFVGDVENLRANLHLDGYQIKEALIFGSSKHNIWLLEAR